MNFPQTCERRRKRPNGTPLSKVVLKWCSFGQRASSFTCFTPLNAKLSCKRFKMGRLLSVQKVHSQLVGRYLLWKENHKTTMVSVFEENFYQLVFSSNTHLAGPCFDIQQHTDVLLFFALGKLFIFQEYTLFERGKARRSRNPQTFEKRKFIDRSCTRLHRFERPRRMLASRDAREMRSCLASNNSRP